MVPILLPVFRAPPGAAARCDNVGAVTQAVDPRAAERPRRARSESTRSRFSPEEIERRRALAPRPSFPEELPVSARRDEIARAIERHPVVIVAGETGSGKTTQLPKIALAAGRGIGGLIGHTQPRRIAARTVAARIAAELGTELGRAVGYKVRFTDRTSPSAYVKLMTDGILLAETQADPELRQYDTIIVDEAHERSLNIDFLLGYLRELLPRRPDLKVIVTSATIDAERFARHFAGRDGAGAPVIEVSGRLYPVEVRYRPPQANEDGEIDVNEAIADAIGELHRHGPGDVLVFLPGEREIREAAEALRKHHPPGVEILPLYARLSAEEQERVFKPHAGRRVVLATNVAETSLTVPGIRYVVDTGLARVKRYSYRNKVEQLRVEPISQAAAKQRAGRCGRVAAGVCIRLYDEADLAKRPAYTDPEILRASLAAVILRMKALGLPAVEAFPFIDPPAPKAIADGYALLAELGAVDEARALTGVGRMLAKLPIDPRIGRMVLAARDEGALPEVLVIAAALSVQDPRERPLERSQAADEAQKRFADEKSDFLGFLKLWRFYEDAAAHNSNRKLHRLARERFLSFTRLREWRDTHSQLKELAGELGWKVGELAPPPREGAPPADAPRTASYAAVHRALLAGLLGNVGLRTEEANYLGARGIRFWVHPGSALARKAPRWIVAAELTETTRLYARAVAGIEPEWLESVGAHLIRRSQADPHWEKRAAQVVALERGTLYGLPVYVNRRVHYGPIDPVEARKIFIRQALVAGEYETRAPFFAHNRRLVRDIEALEHKSRRPDVLVDEELIYAFYDSRVPAGVTNGAAFEAWREEAERKDPKLLFLERDDLMRHEAAGITTAQFPPCLEMAGRSFALEYLHDPGGPRDGVTLTVPLVALNQVSAARCEWLVPGLLKEKVQLLAKSLPQKVRHRLGPLAEFAAAFVAAVPPSDTPLAEAIARYARAERNVELPRDGFRPETLPAHLAMNFRVLDEHGRQLAMGRNLAQIRAELGGEALERFSALARAEAARAGLTSWSFGDLEEIMEIRSGAQTLVGYPALVDRGTSVALEVFDSPEAARAKHRGGLRRLFMLELKDQVKYLEKNLPGLAQMALAFAASGDGGTLKDQLVAAAFDRVFLAEPLPRTKAEFEARRDAGRPRLALIAQEIARLVATILAERDAVAKKLQATKAFPEVVRDVEAQLARLMPRDFVVATPYERLAHFPRYLRAAAARLEKLRGDPARDARLAAELAPLETQWLREVARTRKLGATPDAQLEQFGWLLEELRVQLFAQELKTPVPVSSKRLAKLWASLQR
ncbi:MAG: ATP-dependent RNA helicase HrpA [Burkholderiales bacterium]|nr:ATP-dependent RNA helicase HrpA [Burkholderiales bacterium]